MKKIATLLFLAFLLSIDCISQDLDSLNLDSAIAIPFFSQEQKFIGLVAGYNHHRNRLPEIGLSLRTVRFPSRSGCMAFPFTSFLMLSNEFRISDDPIWGLKLGVGISGGMSLGLNLIRYTDFEESSVKFRPEVGLGGTNARVVYGYNFHVINNDFSRINKHNFTLQIMFNLKKVKDEKLD